MKICLPNLLSLFFLGAILAGHGNATLIDNQDGTITDTSSGLMWTQIADISGAINWYDASDWAEGLNFAGYDDWRLPNALGSDPEHDGSELAFLWVNSLENVADCSGTGCNFGPFSSVTEDSWFWLGQQLDTDPSFAYATYVYGPNAVGTRTGSIYSFEASVQSCGNCPGRRAWAVRDVLTVPAPGAFTLFLVGLSAVGVTGLSRRRRLGMANAMTCQIEREASTY